MVLEWVIVGGGPHGVHLAIRLLAEANIDPSLIRIVDPSPRLMESWHRCTANTGMTHLRSPGVHHLDLDPYSLLQFAKQDPPVDTKRMFARPYNRPSVPLFAAHCAMVMERYGVHDLHVQGRVAELTMGEERVSLTLDNGEELEARQVLLAMGASDQPRRPEWSRDLPASSVRHIFEPGFALEPEQLPDRVAVVGAGISGAQVALRLADAGKQTTLITRHDLRKNQFDSDPGWLGPKSMTRFLKIQDPDVRRKVITKARHLGSLSPEIHRELRRMVQSGDVQLERGEIGSASWSGEAIELAMTARTLEVDAVLLATGFEARRPGGTLIDNLVDAGSLPCAACGFPLVDRHLRWHKRVFVTGPLAELEVGPASRNLIGARRAAERIVPVAKRRWRLGWFDKAW